MLDEKLIMLFVMGVLLGGFMVMLLWLSSPSGMTVDVFAESITETSVQELNVTPGILLASDGSGRTITTTGERGTPASFIDPYGQRRDVVCYTSIYCIDETPCDPCDEEECVDENEKCGYWPGQTDTLAANIPSEGIDYGRCCPPFECINGYCSSDEEDCQDYGQTCGEMQDPSIMTHVAYIDHGECCPPYECVDNTCGREGEECVETGDGCGYVGYVTGAAPVEQFLGECCPPDECINNVCTPPEDCVDYGQICGQVQDPSIATHVAYTDYGECCPPYECVDNLCEEEGCQEGGEMCEYGPTFATTAAPPGNIWYGYCCDPLFCINGYCEEVCEDTGGSCQTDNDCCEGFCMDGTCADCKTSGSCTPGAATCCEGYRCWEFNCVPEQSCDEEGDMCSKDSDCCNNLICFEGYCAEETECGEDGDTCGLGVECCSGLFCNNNDECEECADVGDFCGGYTSAGIPCCPGGYCYMEFCEAETAHLCEDDENGPDYYSEGSATGEYEGNYGTYTDYCINDNDVLDYYCTVNNEYAPIEAGIVTCPSGCSNGACN